MDTLAQGIEQYTDGASTLNDGVSAYVDGVNKLSAGASQLQPLVEGLTTVKGAIQQMNAALDGKGDVTEDINAAAQALAAGTQQLQDSVDATEWKQIQKQIKDLTIQGKTDYRSRSDVAEVLQKQISAPMAKLLERVRHFNHTWKLCRHRFRSGNGGQFIAESKKTDRSECRFG